LLVGKLAPFVDTNQLKSIPVNQCMYKF